MPKYFLVMSYNPDGSPNVKHEVSEEHARTLRERAGIRCQVDQGCN